MDVITAATAAAPAAVLIITELLKLVPVQFTSKHPAWVNLIVSFIAAVIVSFHSFTTWNGIAVLLVNILYTSVVAAIAYNQFTSHLTQPRATVNND